MNLSTLGRAIAVILLAVGCGQGTIIPTASVAPSTTAPTPLSNVGLGDSVPGAGHCGPGCRSYVVVFGELAAATLGRPVATTNLARNDGFTSERLLGLIRSQSVVRDAVAGADLITIRIGWNDWQGPCSTEGLAECLANSQAQFEVNLDSTLDEVDAVRGSRPTAVRILTFANPFVGDDSAATWGTEDASAIATLQMVFSEGLTAVNAMICRVAEAHGSLCVDMVGPFNGPAGDRHWPEELRDSQAQMDLIAGSLDQAGYEPLR